MSFLDLETIIKDWARGEFDDLANKKQKKLRKKERDSRQSLMNITIDWSGIDIVHDTIEFPVMDDNVGKSKAVATKQPELQDSGSVDSGLAGSARPTVSVLFRTTFKNRTDSEQEYTMKTEKTTKSSFSTETESGYTKGFSMEVTLKTPCEVFEANAGYSREYSLANTAGETFEEELHWGVDSVIKVKPKSVAEAKLVIFEKKQSGHFRIRTTMKGIVYVTFTNIKDNNSHVMSCSENIGQILEEHVRLERGRGNAMEYVNIDGKTRLVTITTRGQCRFQYGVQQEVQVDQRDIGQNTDE